MIEWFIVVAMYLPSGEAHATYRTGFPTKERCEIALREDMKAVFGGMAAVKGDCLPMPPRPAGLPQPVAPKGAKST